jgi:hypothetical protein
MIRPDSDAHAQAGEAARADRQVVYRDPASLKPHPLFAELSFEMEPEDSEKMAELQADIALNGVLEPLLLTPGGIVGGRHRCRAAVAAGVAQVPCLLFPEDRALELIVASLRLHRHFSKLSLAYKSLPISQRYVMGGKTLRSNLPHMKSLRNSLNADSIGVQGGRVEYSVENFCAKWGFSKDVFDQARKVQSRLESLPPGTTMPHRDEPGRRIDPKAWVSLALDLWDMGFQAIMAGLGYAASGKKMRGEELTGQRSKFWEHINENLERSLHGFKRWDQFSAEQKAEVLARVPGWTASLPAEFAKRAWMELSQRRQEFIGGGS